MYVFICIVYYTEIVMKVRDNPDFHYLIVKSKSYGRSFSRIIMYTVDGIYTFYNIHCFKRRLRDWERPGKLTVNRLKFD